MGLESGELIVHPVRMKIEEGAKGEVKVTVAVDGDDPDNVRQTLVDQYAKLKLDLAPKAEPQKEVKVV